MSTLETQYQDYYSRVAARYKARGAEVPSFDEWKSLFEASFKKPTIQTKIYSCFPGTGKSYLYHNRGDRIIFDSDSSNFSWSSPGVRNPDFPKNYIDHIQELIGMADIILVSSHKEVRNALTEANIDFEVVIPTLFCKDEYIQRFKDRGNPDAFIQLISLNWDMWLSDIINSDLTIRFLTKCQYLSDIL